MQRQGHEAFAYDIAPPVADTLAVSPDIAARFRSGQINDIARLFDVCRGEKIEAIIHSAGMVGLEPSLEQPIATYQTNIMGLVNVCEVARQLEMRRVVFVSSNAAYHKGSGATLVETDPAFSIRDGNPAGHYGTSKMAGEAIGLAYASFQNVDFLSIRITAIYGFGMRSPMYIKPMVENSVLGRPTRFATGGRMKRDYTHVLDCSDGIVTALLAPPWKSRRTARHQCRKRQCTNRCRGCQNRSRHDSGCRHRDRRRLDAAGRAERQDANLARYRPAKRLLNWSPKWPLEAGIAEYAETFRRHLSRSVKE